MQHSDPAEKTTSSRKSGKKKNKADKKKVKIGKKLWGKKLLNHGRVTVPNQLFYFQHKLELDTLDMNILLFLLSAWQSGNPAAFPSAGRIAAIIGCGETTVRRHLTKMEQRGYAKRIKPDRVSAASTLSDQFDFSGLTQAMTQLQKNSSSEP